MIHIGYFSRTYALALKSVVEAATGRKAGIFDLDNIQMSEKPAESCLWIMDVWDNSLFEAKGFTTAWNIAKMNNGVDHRFLLIFNYMPDSAFPEEGPFWITYSFSDSLKNKMEKILKAPPTTEAEFVTLKTRFPVLTRTIYSKGHRV